MYKTCGRWQVYYFFNVTFSSVVCPKAAPLRRWWIQQCVCLEGAVLPWLAKKILPLAFEGQCLKKRQKSSESLPPRGVMVGEGLWCEGGEIYPTAWFSYWANKDIFIIYVTRFMQSCKLFFDYFCIMATLKKIWNHDVSLTSNHI